MVQHGCLGMEFRPERTHERIALSFKEIRDLKEKNREFVLHVEEEGKTMKGSSMSEQVEPDGRCD